MKYRTSILISIFFLILMILIVVYHVICGVETSVRHSAVQSALSHLPVLIEGYRADKGIYPPSLDELVAAEPKPEGRDLIKLILNDRWNDHYKYHPETNGFTITVIMPSGWFVKKEQLERKYQVGETLKSLDAK